MRLLENSNTISLYKTLTEDFFNPGKYFQIFQDMLDIDAEKWNSTNDQKVRDSLAMPFVKAFWDKYREEMTEDDLIALFDDLEDNNYHTEYRLLHDLVWPKKNFNESENLIDKDQKDFEDLVLRDFLIYLEDRHGVESLEDAERVRHNVTNEDINDYFTGLFPEVFDYDDEETALAAERFIRNKYGVLDGRTSDVQENDDETNYAAEEEADATERMERRYGSMNEDEDSYFRGVKILDNVYNNSEYEALWDKSFKKLVPKTGKAETPIGEVLRCFSSLSHAYYQNGDIMSRLQYQPGYLRDAYDLASAVNELGDETLISLKDKMWSTRRESAYAKYMAAFYEYFIKKYLMADNLTEAKKPKTKQDTRVVMQQGNVTCIKENDTYLVFENEADNEVEHESEDSAMQDFLERVGIDANTELEDKENK